jgi:DNA-binding NarL/FixJ family response regulator
MLRPLPSLRLLIADDHAAFACSLEALLAHDDSVHVIGVAHDGAEAVELAASLEPDVVLLDVNMPRLDRFQAAERIKERNPATRIVIVTATAGDETAAQGVERVVLKADIGEELLGAIHAETPA